MTDQLKPLLASAVAALKSFDYASAATHIVPSSTYSTTDSRIVLVHFLVYGILLGSVFWVTFVSGIVLFKALPLRHFGAVQTAQFPHYFRTQT
jgi:hypothetical protein